MADPTVGGVSTEGEKAKSQNGEKKKQDLDPEFLSCLLQPSPPDSDPNYIGIRRLLLHRKAQAGRLNRKVFLNSRDEACTSIAIYVVFRAIRCFT